MAFSSASTSSIVRFADVTMLCRQLLGATKLRSSSQRHMRRVGRAKNCGWHGKVLEVHRFTLFNVPGGTDKHLKVACTRQVVNAETEAYEKEASCSGKQGSLSACCRSEEAEALAEGTFREESPNGRGLKTIVSRLATS